MAKVEKFYGDYDYVVTPGSKNKTLEYVGDEKVNFSFKIEIPEKYQNKYFQYPTTTEAIKEGNDLILISHLCTTKNKIKMVSTTIKNYFLSDKFEPIKLYSPIDGVGNYEILHTDNGTNCIYDRVEDDENKNFILTSAQKNSELILSKGGSDFVYDKNGNDIYSAFGQYYDGYSYNLQFDSIIDEKGNDKYSTNTNNRLYAYDGKGNDEYRANAENCCLLAYDFDGKDKYFVSESGKLIVYEYNGNDKYEIKTSNYIYIEEYAGNDNYLIDKAKIENNCDIDDYKGNDKYTLTNSSYIDIDESKGSDKYVLSECTSIQIDDDAGNNKYTFEKSNTDIDIFDYLGKSTYISNGLTVLKDLYIYEFGKYNDKYKLNGLISSSIRDEAGNDSYTLTDDSDIVNVCDEAGNDKYTVKNSSNFEMNDYQGKDKYNFENAFGMLVTDSSIEKDSYNLINSSDIVINDNGDNVVGDVYSLKGTSAIITDLNGDDTYKVEFSLASNEINIIDKAGEKDSLSISKSKIENIVLMAGYDADGTLLIYDKEMNGLITISNFFDEDYQGFGDGQIEKIKAGSKSFAIDELQMCNQVNAVRESVENWLSFNSEFASVQDVLSLGSQTQIDSLIACFQGQ